MPRIAYVEGRKFQRKTLAIIELADKICTDYQRQGYNLTLRQLYYQFISRDFFPNSERSYKNLGDTINNARLAGLIDWSHLEDRGRSAHSVNWLGVMEPTVADLVEGVGQGYAFDLWREQEYRPEIWVEKQALEDVVSRAASRTRTGYFACKGYVSQSEMWAAAQRLDSYIMNGHQPIIFHLGDHDPSGIDMTRDIAERLSLFVGQEVEVRRLALNLDQIDQYNPPPNPAKITDSRFESYEAEYGSSSWELDALSPEVLVDIIDSEVKSVMDMELWEREVEHENSERGRISEEINTVTDNWDVALAAAREEQE